MVIYPAIDIKDGKCVRLFQGKFDEVTVFSEKPSEMGLNWQEKGAKFLHIVDLDGARFGGSKNLDVIEEIVNKLKIPCQLGGGIRTMENIETVLSKGVNRVILGTAAVNNPDFVKEVVVKYKEKIVIGIDAKDGMVAIEGWEKTSEFTALVFAKKMQEIGVKTIVYTDISKDGMLSGPNVEALRIMNNELKDVDVIASGGVTSIEDLKILKSADMSGAIIGRAIYTGDIKLEDALDI
jgi:phosphoribosylformimino-5-aminoimidazole carboxamide ribotide isomerase